MAPTFYLLIWFATQFLAPAVLRQFNEPMASRNASYTVQELADLARQSGLRGGQVTAGPAWVVLEGKKNTINRSIFSMNEIQVRLHPMALS